MHQAPGLAPSCVDWVELAGCGRCFVRQRVHGLPKIQKYGHWYSRHLPVEQVEWTNWQPEQGCNLEAKLRLSLHLPKIQAYPKDKKCPYRCGRTVPATTRVHHDVLFGTSNKSGTSFYSFEVYYNMSCVGICNQVMFRTSWFLWFLDSLTSSRPTLPGQGPFEIQ